MNTIKAISWNVNGLRAVQRKGFMDWFEAESPDILCLQETKLTEEQIPPELLTVDGYQNFFNSANRKGYSGVALYTKQAPESVTRGFGIERFDSEGRVLMADYGQYVIFGIYFPNGRRSEERLQYKMDFYDAFLEVAQSVRAQGKNVLICGDLNTAHKEIDLARPKANEKVSGFLPVERAWMDRLIDHGYVDTLRVFNDQPGQYSYWDQMSRGPGKKRGLAHRLLFRRPAFCGQTEQRLHPAGGDGLGPLPGGDRVQYLARSYPLAGFRPEGRTLKLKGRTSNAF